MLIAACEGFRAPRWPWRSSEGRPRERRSVRRPTLSLSRIYVAPHTATLGSIRRQYRRPVAALVYQRDKHLINLFIRRRKLRHALIQVLTDQRAGEHQLGRRRLVHRTIARCAARDPAAAASRSPSRSACKSRTLSLSVAAA